MDRFEEYSTPENMSYDSDCARGRVHPEMYTHMLRIMAMSVFIVTPGVDF